MTSNNFWTLFSTFGSFKFHPYLTSCVDIIKAWPRGHFRSPDLCNSFFCHKCHILWNHTVLPLQCSFRMSWLEIQNICWPPGWCCCCLAQQFPLSSSSSSWSPLLFQIFRIQNCRESRKLKHNKFCEVLCYLFHRCSAAIQLSQCKFFLVFSLFILSLLRF